MIHEYNRKIEDGIFYRCEKKIMEIKVNAMDELYQEVPNDYFESEKFNKTLNMSG